MNLTRDIASTLGLGSAVLGSIGALGLMASILPVSIPAMIALGIAGLMTEKSYRK